LVKNAIVKNVPQYKEVKKLPQAPYTRLFDMDGRDFEITNKSS